MYDKNNEEILYLFVDYVSFEFLMYELILKLVGDFTYLYATVPSEAVKAVTLGGDY